MKDKLNLKITAVHINHMIRDEAVDDEKFVEDLCGKLSIPYISFKMDVKMIAQREKLLPKFSSVILCLRQG